MSIILLNQLEFAARHTSAKVRIDLDCSTSQQRCEVTFHAGDVVPRGNRREAVTTYGADAVASALTEMLKRLGDMRDLPTPENLIERATPRQRAVLEDLLMRVQRVKTEILLWGAASEPRLAPPRSSLNPRIIDSLVPPPDEEEKEKAARG